MPRIDGPVSPLEQYRASVIMAASGIYQARLHDEDPNEAEIFARSLPVNLGDASPDALAHANRAIAEVQVASRVLGRLAADMDVAENGRGIRRIVAKIEVTGTRLLNQTTLPPKDLRPGGLVDVIRGIKTDQAA